MKQPVVCTWVNVDEGCVIATSVGGSNAAHLMIGDNQLEIALDADSLRTLVRSTTAALAEMDARFEHEEAERAARENNMPAGCSA
jgi:hypothetical protein